MKYKYDHWILAADVQAHLDERARAGWVLAGSGQQADVAGRAFWFIWGRPRPGRDEKEASGGDGR